HARDSRASVMDEATRGASRDRSEALLLGQNAMHEPSTESRSPRGGERLGAAQPQLRRPDPVRIGRRVAKASELKSIPTGPPFALNSWASGGGAVPGPGSRRH